MEAGPTAEEECQAQKTANAYCEACYDESTGLPPQAKDGGRNGQGHVGIRADVAMPIYHQVLESHLDDSG